MPNGELVAQWRVPPGERFRLSTRDPATIDGAPGGDEQKTVAATRHGPPGPEPAEDLSGVVIE